MPALPPVPGALKSRIFWTVEGDANAVTLLYWHYSGGAPVQADIDSFVSAFAGAAAADLAPEFLSSTSITGVDARDLSSEMGVFAADATVTPGTRTGTRLPPAAAAVMNYHQTRYYRGGKPRSYWPFGASADVAATGFWADAFVTEYEAAVQSLTSRMIGGFAGMTVEAQALISYYGPPNKVVTSATTGRVRTVSTRRDAPGGTGAPIISNITSSAGTKIIGSQRRRNRNA